MSKSTATGRSRTGRWLAPGWVLGLALAFDLALALSWPATSSRAADLLGPPQPPGVPELLASVTNLSDAAMAEEKATGVQPPALLNDPTGRQRVMLWDEYNVPPQLGPQTEPVINTGK